MKTEKTTLDLASFLLIDKEYLVRVINSLNLVFFYNRPNWIVLNDSELEIFKYLNFHTIGNSIERFGEEAIVLLLKRIFQRNLVGSKKRKKTKPILPLHLYLTNECNLFCPHCYMSAGKRLMNELSFENWKQIINSFITYGGKQISISGGEPTIVPYFLDLCKYIKMKKSSVSIKLLTNGTFLNLFPIDSLSKYINEIQISLDGPNPKINDLIRGNGHFDTVFRNLYHINHYSGIVSISMCILREYIDDFVGEFPSVYKRLVSVRKTIKIGLATDLQDGRQYQKLSYADAKDSLTKMAHVFSDTVEELNIDGREEKNFERNARVISCGYGGTISVTADGCFFPCGVPFKEPITKYIENMDFRKMLDNMYRILEENVVDNIPECNSCKLKYICGGICRIENHKRNGSFREIVCIDSIKDDLFLALFKDDIVFEKE